MSMFIWAFLVSFCSLFWLLAFLATLLPLPPALEGRRLQSAAHFAQRGYGLVWRVIPLYRMIRCEKDRKQFQMLQKRRKTFYLSFWNVHVCNNGISSIHGKELLEQLIFNPLWARQISHSNKCSTYPRDWCLNKMRSQDWKQLVGRIIHGNMS